MSDDPSENHDGNTQPLPANVGPHASTEPLPAGAIADPVASEVVARRPLPSWVPTLAIGLIVIATVLLALAFLPQLLGPTVLPSPSPTFTFPSVTPTQVEEEPPAETPPPEPEPTVSVPAPTVEPTEPLPTPTG